MAISRAIQSAFERYQAGSLQKAANICIETAAIQPNRIKVLLLPGEICTQPGNPDAAIEYFNEALKVAPVRRTCILQSREP